MVHKVNLNFLIADQGTTGDIGTYAFFRHSSAAVAPGTNVAASSLTYADDSGAGSTNPSGTWRCMGRGSASGRATLYLRIS
jgi:hypothetical protein